MDKHIPLNDKKINSKNIKICRTLIVLSTLVPVVFNLIYLTGIVKAKLDITPLIVAKILFNVKNYDKAIKYIKDVTELNDFDEKIKLLKKMSKYEEAIEIIMKDKKADKEQYASSARHRLP